MAQDHRFTRLALLGLALVVFATAALPAAAEDSDTNACSKHRRDRKGWLVGFNVGVGGGSLGFKDGGRDITEDNFEGASGGLRGGYAFSNSFALTLEARGFGTDDDEEEWGVGGAFVTATWWPEGGGFFVRAGLGSGGGDVFVRELGEKIHTEEEGGALFGLGYEWQLGRRFALGVAADAYGFEWGNAGDLEDATVGVGTVSIQLNWYL